MVTPTPLARALLGGLAAFWGLRLWMQWFMYDAELWQGKPFETAMQFLFTGLWVFLTGTFFVTLWHNLHA